jgi:hypothetical protein
LLETLLNPGSKAITVANVFELDGLCPDHDRGR